MNPSIHLMPETARTSESKYRATQFQKEINFVFSLTHIAYSPTNEHLQKIMENVAATLNLTVYPFKSADEMQLLLQNEVNLAVIIGGVQFDDALSGNVDLPTNLSAAIRFPGELRTHGFSTYTENSWRTNLLFPLYQIAGPRNPFYNFTATPGTSFHLLNLRQFIFVLFKNTTRKAFWPSSGLSPRLYCSTLMQTFPPFKCRGFLILRG